MIWVTSGLCGILKGILARLYRNHKASFGVVSVISGSLLPTVATGVSMNADYSIAARALPADFFLFDEFSYTSLFDILKIFKHTHAIFCSVTFVQLLQSGTGVSGAQKAILPGFAQLIAVFDTASEAAIGHILVAPQAAGTFLFFSKVSITNAAIHTTGGNHSRFNGHS